MYDILHDEKSKEKDIEVSVICLAYNHGPYIRDALKGFVKQKTNFKYEVIVHDDASTDNTADIIREYEKKYPDIIKPIYQKENQYSKKSGFVKKFVIPKIKGKYVAVCEGDDYWTDENKLQLQYDAMEEHPECSMCAHYTKIKYMDKEHTYSELNEFPPRQKGICEGIYNPEDFMIIALDYNIHICSTLVRAEDYCNRMLNPPDFVKSCPVGDKAMLMYMIAHGSLYFINRTMSVYRWGVPGSWTSRVQRQKSENLEMYRKLIKSYEIYRTYLDGRYKENIDYIIALYKYNEAWMSDNYKKLLQKECRLIVKKKSFLTRLKIYMLCYCPRLFKLYSKLKSKLVE